LGVEYWTFPMSERIDGTKGEKGRAFSVVDWTPTVPDMINGKVGERDMGNTDDINGHS